MKVFKHSELKKRQELGTYPYLCWEAYAHDNGSFFSAKYEGVVYAWCYVIDKVHYYPSCRVYE